MRSFQIAILSTLMLSLIAKTATADVIRSPITATASGFSSNIFPVNNTINQSGLSAGFTSGVTDYDTYVGGNPTHSTSNININHYFGNSPPFGQIDYDLGDVYSVSSLGLWGATFSASLQDFNLLLSTDAGFAGALPVGLSAALNANVQDFSFAPVNARYARIDVINIMEGQPIPHLVKSHLRPRTQLQCRNHQPGRC